MGNIWAQRIDNTGAFLWPSAGSPSSTGVQVTAQTGNETYIKMIKDASNNILMTWIDERDGVGQRDIYATKLSSTTGEKLWLPVPGCNTSLGDVCDSTVIVVKQGGDQPTSTSNSTVSTGAFSVVSDKNNGMIVVWDDGAFPKADIYAQRLNNNGVVQWASGGAPVGNQDSTQRFPMAVEGTLATGPDGAIISFIDNRNYITGTSGTATSVHASYINYLGTLPLLSLTDLRLTAALDNNNITVNWQILNNIDNNIVKHILQRSTDGVNFTDIRSYNVNPSQRYSHLDYNPNIGANFYRVKAVFANGTSKLSNAVNIIFGNFNSGVKIYPNPVVNNLNVQISGLKTGVYALKVISADGKQYVMQKLNVANTSIALALPVTVLAQGSYVLQVIDANGKTQFAQPFIKTIN